MSWRIVKLGSVISQRKESITIDNTVEYKRCRVQVNRKGVILRDVIKGILINTKKQQVCKEGDFLVAEIDAKVGGYGFVPKELEGAIVSSHYFLFEVDESKMLKSYLAWLIKTEIIQEQINSKGSTNYAAIRPSNVLNFEIPLPLIEEQEELVKRLHNIDKEYSELQYELNNQQTYLQQLRQSILQEAVQGKLTQQSPTDEPASKLLERIKAEKQKLIAAGKLKKEKELPPITEDETPFELPEGWVWCRFNSICKVITCGLASTPKYFSEGKIFLSAKNVKPFKFLPDDHKFVDEQTYIKVTQNAKPEVNDILVTRVGAGIGEAAIIDRDIDFAYYVSLTLIKPVQEYLNSEYILTWLNSPVGIQNAISYTSGLGGSQGNLNVERVRNFLFPLPPLSEQHRIVAKVQQLLQMVNRLEQQVQQSQTQAKQLLQAVLKEAFNSKAKVYEDNELETMAAEE